MSSLIHLLLTCMVWVKAIMQKKKEQRNWVLTEKKIHLVYGGGNLGLMGRVSKAAYDGGSQVLGVIPKALSVGGCYRKYN
ncbi:hypothetical protein ACOSQ4_029487 [Xanthoceras sorbifolium]